MKKITTFVLFLIALFCNAQNLKESLFIDTGYTYFNRSFGEIGARFDVDNKAGIFIGANVLIGGSNGKLLVIPDINATKYFDAGGKSNKLQFPFVRLAASPKTITPQIGFGAIIGEIAVGYGISINNSENYNTKGFRVSINFNIPLKLKMRLF